MKGLQLEMERQRQLVLALVGREEVGASGSGCRSLDDKVWGGDERDARRAHLSPETWSWKLSGGKVTGWMETGRKETERKEIGGLIHEGRRREGRRRK